MSSSLPGGSYRRHPQLPHDGLLCCGVRVDAMTQEDAVVLLATHRGRLCVHLCNAYTLALARSDPPYAAMLNRADLNLPDGTPLAWLGRRRGMAAFARATRGPDLMREVLILGQAQGTRHYLYGSTRATLERLQRQIRILAPRADLVGLESPPFGELGEAEFTDASARIIKAGAHVVWVGLGTPKQDWAVEELARRLDVVVVPIGAAFDFLAGTTAEAPRWLRGSGFEWVFRLLMEPRRLWRRYLLGNLGFLYGVLVQGVKPTRR